MILDIIFRSCTRVNSEHGGTRPLRATKSQVTLVCLKSLLESCRRIGRVHVLDDYSHKEDVEKIQRLLKQYSEEHIFKAIDVGNNGASMEESFNYARENKFDLIYFCEDDYLHLPQAISSMINFYQNFGKECIIHPTDYVDRYLRDKPYPSLVYLGGDRHWRTILHTTCTFMINRRILEKYWNVYLKLAQINKGEAGGEDKTINKIYKKEICVSPIPSLAAHFSPEPEMPHFVDWEGLFNEIKQGLDV